MYLVVLVLLATAFTSTLGQIKTPEYVKKMSEECIKSENLSPADAAYMMSNKPPITQGEKCYAGCMFEKMGLIENGVWNKEKSQALCKEMFEGPMLEKALAAHAVCDKEMDGVKSEKCEGAAKMVTCFHKTMTDIPIAK